MIENSNNKIDITTTSNNQKEERQIYDDFLEEVSAYHPIEYFQKDFETLGKDATLELFYYISTEIFGKSKLLDQEMETFVEGLKVTNDRRIFNKIPDYLSSLEKGQENIQKVPSLNNTSSVVTLVHEFIHYVLKRRELSFENKDYYEKILSMYGEKISSKILEDFGFLIEKKVESTRLEQLLEIQTLSLELERLKTQTIQNNKIDSPKDIDPYLLYQKQLEAQYITGYIYGEALSMNWSNDKIHTTKKVREYWNKIITLEDLLKYYDIDRNQKTVDISKRKVKSILEDTK